MRVGLAGYGDIPTGLGVLNTSLCRKLPITHRYIQRHAKFGAGKGTHERIVTSCDALLDGIDALLFVERPFPSGVLELARRRNITTICIVMPEWTPPDLPWLNLVDLFIAFTNQCYQYCVIIGVGSRTARLECPMDLDEFPFRERTCADSLVYCDGNGGVHERKGRPVVDRLLHNHPALVRVKSLRSGAAVPTPADLYKDADCVLVPGRFDGLGLTTLEAMASGCVVLATDCEPYSEFLNGAYGLSSRLLIPAETIDWVKIWSHLWPAHDLHEDDVYKAICSLRDRTSNEISSLSVAGRRYIETGHGIRAWDLLWETICGVRV